MIKQAKGKIFLGDERGFNETAWFQSYNTFNFGRYQQEHKQPFGPMYALNDDSLSGGSSLKMLIEEDTIVILLPVAGAIQCKDNNGTNNLLAAGQSQLLYAAKGDIIEVCNPFKEEWVNYLQIWIRSEDVREDKKARTSTYRNVNEELNSLVRIFDDISFVVSLGKFTGRGETNYIVENEKSGVFVFVLEGAFEVEGRLLHARDGLALFETGSIEMEALSNDALILTIELPATSSDH